MTKDYHLTQEQVVALAEDYGNENWIGEMFFNKEQLQAFANAVLDEVLGEPVAWMYQTKDFTGTAYAITQNLPEYEYTNEVPLYAPKEMTCLTLLGCV